MNSMTFSMITPLFHNLSTITPPAAQNILTVLACAAQCSQYAGCGGFVWDKNIVSIIRYTSYRNSGGTVFDWLIFRSVSLVSRINFLSTKPVTAAVGIEHHET